MKGWRKTKVTGKSGARKATSKRRPQRRKSAPKKGPEARKVALALAATKYNGRRIITPTTSAGKSRRLERAATIDMADTPIIHIGRVIDVAKVAKSVVQAIAVDVVDFFRLLVVGKKPRNPVRVIMGALVTDSHVFPAATAIPYLACGVAHSDAAVRLLEPSKEPRFRVVGENIADRIWYKFCSHAESPLSVVRGLTVGAVSAPILTRESNNGR